MNHPKPQKDSRVWRCLPPIMNIRSATLFAGLLLAASGCATADNGAKAAGAAPAASPNVSVAKGGLPVLKTGITSDEVVALVGKPLEVKAQPAPEGKAEIWSYRRLVDEQQRQVATSVNIVGAYNPITDAGPSQSPELQFTQVHIRTYQVTELLIFNDKLVTAKQWNEQKTTYDN
jgi:hypothetical protein